MIIVDSRKLKAVQQSAKIANLLNTISETQLREWVQRISVPRNFTTEPEQNRAIAEWLARVFEELGYRVERQGEFSNIVVLPKASFKEVILVGAHYDSVPMCPGADDNGSAVAAMLGCAAACSLWLPTLPAMFVAFNREEEGLRGSRDFVQSFVSKVDYEIHCAHILEMVGYASSEPGSQRIPTGLPIKLRDSGDFLGLLANGKSSEAMNFALSCAETYVPGLPVLGLNVKLGLEKLLPVLARSDHAPFWEQGIPAVMWTDTAEYRNQNYHRHTDTPETLDYGFLRRVTQLLTASVISQASMALGQGAVP